jgi:hypothetical protein
MAMKNFITLSPGHTVIKHFTSVIEFSYKARVFATGNTLKPSLMFAGKTGGYLSETAFRCSTLL